MIGSGFSDFNLTVGTTFILLLLVCCNVVWTAVGVFMKTFKFPICDKPEKEKIKLIFDVISSQSGREKNISIFRVPLQSWCYPVQKNLPWKIELAWQFTRYLWRGTWNFKIFFLLFYISPILGILKVFFSKIVGNNIEITCLNMLHMNLDVIFKLG